jgi:D-arginine dehydrogenase
VVDDFYMTPEGGKLIASPVDEIPAEPCDAQPEELDVAVAAAKVEEYTTLSVRRIGHRWAGLRTFAPDRTPVVGADPREPSFFWLAGQGGFGLQTAPAVAAAAASLLLDEPWPEALAAEGVTAHELTPERLIHGN